eukprot:UN02188
MKVEVREYNSIIEETSSLDTESPCVEPNADELAILENSEECAEIENAFDLATKQLDSQLAARANKEDSET